MDERTRTLLLGAAGCAGLFGLILVLAYGFPAARELDSRALTGFIGFDRAGVDATTRKLVHLGDPPVVGIAGLLLAAIALLRGRPRVAAAVVVLLGATSVSSQILKAVLAYPRFEQSELANIAPAAFPSGHSTAVMALAVAGVLVVPARMRTLAAVVGGALALAVGVSVIATGWHFSSDVAGGFLLATGWGLAIAAGLRQADLRWPQRTGRAQATIRLRHVTEAVVGTGLVTLAGIGGLLVLAGGALVIFDADLGALVRGHTAAVLVGAGLLVLALGLLAGVLAGVRQHGPR